MKKDPSFDISAITLLNKLGEGLIVLDAEKRIAEINDVAASILGHPQGDLIGADIQDIVPDFQPYFIIAGDEDIRDELFFERVGKRYFEFFLSPLFQNLKEVEGYLIVLRDITAQKENELYLLQRTQAVEKSPGAIVVTDTNGVITYVNPQFTLLTGYDVDEVIGNKVNIVSSGLTPKEVYQDMWKTIFAGKTWRGEFLNRKKNGELYWEWTVIAPVQDAKGEVVNFISVKENITERKRAEEALKEANLQLGTQLEEIKKLEATLREQAIRDPLTQLYNRRFLVDALDREFSTTRRRKKSLSIFILDIDHFKLVNDTYGHRAGDACLVKIAHLLKEFFREADIVCRFGGEEFLVVLPDSDPESAKRRAEAFRKLVADTEILFDGKELKLTVSGGVASSPRHGENPEEVIQKADQALYNAKRRGRNRVVLCES